MKTLTRLMSVGAVLTAGSVSLAADCQPSTAPRVYNNNGNVARYSYRSGYMGAAQSAPVTTTAPVRSGYMTPGGYSLNQSSLGPERNLQYAQARQAIRGW